MNRRFNTLTKRRKNSYNLLEDIDEYNNEKQQLETSANMLLGQLMGDTEGTDAELRSESVDCANQINYSIKELNALDGAYKVRSCDAAKWITISQIQLLEYIPNIINEITTPQGQPLPSTVPDFFIVHDLFKKYDSFQRRDQFLKHSDIWDDDFVMRRTIMKEEKIYEPVTKDVYLSINFWNKSFDLNKVYEPMLKDIKKTKYETDPVPKLPKKEEFMNLLEQSGAGGGVAGDVDTMKRIMQLRGGSGKQEEYFKYLDVAIEDLRFGEKNFELHDKDCSKDYCQYVANTIPEYLYYEFQDKTFVMMKVIKKDIIHRDPKFKKEFSPEHNKANDMVNFYIYEYPPFEKYYYDYKWYIQLTLSEVSGNYKDKTFRACPTTSIDDASYIEVSKSLQTKMTDDIVFAKYMYDNSPEDNRCEDEKPGERYKDFQNFIIRLNLINVQQCDIFFKYVMDNIDPFIHKRCIALKNTVTDEDNITIMLDLLTKRLTKNTGTLLIWYQSLLQFDDSYFSHKKSKDIAFNKCKDVVCSRAFSHPDEHMFNKYKNPRFIDIQKPDKLFNGRKFQAGDSIYIINNYTEQLNKVTRVESVLVSETDFSNADLSTYNEKGLIDGAVNKRIRVTRLVLQNPLQDWCYVEDVDDIRVLKVL